MTQDTEEEYHTGAFYRHEYAHGTQYLGRMGKTAFALFDYDDNGTIFPLLMTRETWPRRKDAFEEVSPDELPEDAVERIEQKFANRKSITERLP